MDPTEALKQAQEWIAVMGTGLVMLAGAVVAAAKLYADTRKKLDAIIEGVEASDNPNVKRRVKATTEMHGVDLAGDVERVTRRLKK